MFRISIELQTMTRRMWVYDQGPGRTVVLVQNETRARLHQADEANRTLIECRRQFPDATITLERAW